MPGKEELKSLLLWNPEMSKNVIEFSFFLGLISADFKRLKKKKARLKRFHLIENARRCGEEST